jgi:hypothetical protein
MEDKRITAAELQAEWQADMRVLLDENILAHLLQ